MRFLLATDGSEGAAAAARFLQQLSLSNSDEVTLLTVVQHEEGREEGRGILDAAHAALSSTPAVLRRQMRRGNAAVEILDNIVWTAEEGPTDLIVIGGRGMSAIVRFFIGSVAERVAQYAPCSVLVARFASEMVPVQSTPLKRIVVGYDGSKGARLSLNFLLKMPLPADAEIKLTAVLPSRSSTSFLLPALRDAVKAIQSEEKHEIQMALAETLTELRAQGRKVTAEIREGEPATALLEAAKAISADLIVVGALRADDTERLLLGSVSDKIVRIAPCSVLVVRPQKRWG